MKPAKWCAAYKKRGDGKLRWLSGLFSPETTNKDMTSTFDLKALRTFGPKYIRYGGPMHDKSSNQI